MKTASQLEYGERVIIDSIDEKHPSSRRIIEIGFINEIDENHPSSRRVLEFGFTPGQEIELVDKSLFNDPLAFSVRGTVIAIRKNEAECIKVS